MNANGGTPVLLPDGPFAMVRGQARSACCVPFQMGTSGEQSPPGHCKLQKEHSKKVAEALSWIASPAATVARGMISECSQPEN